MKEINYFKLDDGRVLIQWFGKYCPNLCLLAEVYDENKSILSQYGEYKNLRDFNCGKGWLTTIRGEFFKSKKGTPMFAIKENGKHILLVDDWGGCFNDYRGHSLPEDNLYYRRASSNGGGAGCDYAIVPFGYRRKYNISEL